MHRRAMLHRRRRKGGFSLGVIKRGNVVPDDTLTKVLEWMRKSSIAPSDMTLVNVSRAISDCYLTANTTRMQHVYLAELISGKPLTRVTEEAIDRAVDIAVEVSNRLKAMSCLESVAVTDEAIASKCAEYVLSGECGLRSEGTDVLSVALREAIALVEVYK